jgi:hypothetical protein
MGLLIDYPKPGYGSTNDGNSARRIFENHQLSSSISTIDIEIIYNFKIVLQTVSSGYYINIEKFEAYTLKIAKLFVEKYPWYYMADNSSQNCITRTKNN